MVTQVYTKLEKILKTWSNGSVTKGDVNSGS